MNDDEIHIGRRQVNLRFGKDRRRFISGDEKKGFSQIKIRENRVLAIVFTVVIFMLLTLLVSVPLK